MNSDKVRELLKLSPVEAYKIGNKECLDFFKELAENDNTPVDYVIFLRKAIKRYEQL